MLGVVSVGEVVEEEVLQLTRWRRPDEVEEVIDPSSRSHGVLFLGSEKGS